MHQWHNASTKFRSNRSACSQISNGGNRNTLTKKNIHFSTKDGDPKSLWCVLDSCDLGEKLVAPNFEHGNEFVNPLNTELNPICQ